MCSCCVCSMVVRLCRMAAKEESSQSAAYTCQRFRSSEDGASTAQWPSRSLGRIFLQAQSFYLYGSATLACVDWIAAFTCRVARRHSSLACRVSDRTLSRTDILTWADCSTRAVCKEESALCGQDGCRYVRCEVLHSRVHLLCPVLCALSSRIAPQVCLSECGCLTRTAVPLVLTRTHHCPLPWRGSSRQSTVKTTVA
jgi:hypothetical protein